MNLASVKIRPDRTLYYYSHYFNPEQKNKAPTVGDKAQSYIVDRTGPIVRPHSVDVVCCVQALSLSGQKNAHIIWTKSWRSTHQCSVAIHQFFIQIPTERHLLPGFRGSVICGAI